MFSKAWQFASRKNALGCSWSPSTRAALGPPGNNDPNSSPLSSSTNGHKADSCDLQHDDVVSLNRKPPCALGFPRIVSVDHNGGIIAYKLIKNVCNDLSQNEYLARNALRVGCEANESKDALNSESFLKLFSEKALKKASQLNINEGKDYSQNKVLSEITITSDGDHREIAAKSLSRRKTSSRSGDPSSSRNSKDDFERRRSSSLSSVNQCKSNNGGIGNANNDQKRPIGFQNVENLKDGVRLVDSILADALNDEAIEILSKPDVTMFQKMTAQRHLEDSVRLDSCKAMFNLAVCYETGKLGRIDKLRAAELYERAARKGNLQAKINLKSLISEETFVGESRKARCERVMNIKQTLGRKSPLDIIS